MLGASAPGYDDALESALIAPLRIQIPGKGLLTDLINETHENSRYLPQMVLPDNLVAVPNLKDVVKVRDLRAPFPSMRI